MEKPIIKSEFSFNNTVVHEFTYQENNEKFTEENLFEKSNELYTYAYTGKHDGGNLPNLKVSGPFANLVNGIMLAKKDSEAFFIDRIEMKDNNKR